MESDQNPHPEIIPEAIETVSEIVNFLENNPDQTVTTYGHAAGMFAQVAYANSYMNPDLQRERLKEYALVLIQRHGPEIISFLKPELKEVLGINLNDE